MTKQQGDLEKAALIFERACELEGDARRAYLDEACQTNAALRAEVLSMLEAEAAQGKFLSDPTLSVSRPLSEGPGTTIDNYKLLQRIGEGGFGVVYMAEQTRPVKRRVALKIIKLGMDTKQVIARFEAERQALAMMDHPNIAKVLDAGATETGRPYFIMELVKGVAITDYCDSENLTTKERLDLFITICNAVQHAHQKGIIHRDLKPSNVMVTLHDGKPVPKVIDFGIAKATNHELTEKTLFTEYGQFIGTPAYMSPEQAEMSGLDIDTRSDIYSLGVLLYELLTGLTPIDNKRLRSAAIKEIQRIIREEEPRRPSTRLSEMSGDLPALPKPNKDEKSLEPQPSSIQYIAKHRHTDPNSLAKLLRGDLDWIVMKALEKDRARRYETANGFAMDIGRYLNDEPVLASPPSAGYRIGKFIRRNKLMIGAATAVFLALAMGLAVSTALYSRAEKERSSAVAAREEAEQARLEALRLGEAEAGQRAKAETNEKEATLRAQQLEETLKFVRSMLASARPQVAKGRELTVREVLDKASETIHEELKDQPLVEANVRRTIAWTYMDLGRYSEAVTHFESVREVLTEHYGQSNGNAISATSNLAGAHYHSGDWARAVELNQEALEGARALWGEEHLRTASIMARLANHLRAMGRYNEAEPLAERQMEIRISLNAPRRDMADAQGALGWLYVSQGRYKEAERLFRDSLEIRRNDWGEENPWTIQHISELAFICLRQGKSAEAERLAGEAAELARKYLDPLDDKTSTAIFRHTWALEKLERFKEAEQTRLELLRINRKRYGEHSAAVCTSLSELTRIASRGGDETAAKGYAQELVTLGRSMMQQPQVDAGLLNDCAMRLLELAPAELRDPETALLMVRQGLDSLTEDNPLFLDTLSLALERTGDLGEAIASQERAVNAASPTDVGHSTYVVLVTRWLDLLRRAGDIEAEDAAVRRLLEMVQQVSDAEDSRNLALMNNLAVVLARRGRLVDAIPIYRQLLEFNQARYPEGHPQVALQLNNLGASLLELERYDEAAPMLRRSLETYVSSGGRDTFSVGNVRSHLGECLMRIGRFSGAEKEQLESYRVLKNVNGARHERTLRSARRLVELYETWGKPGDAAEWRAKLPESSEP